MEYAFVSIILVFLLLFYSLLERKLKSLEKRLSRMQRGLDSIAEAQGIDHDAEFAEVDQLLAAGKKIQAIGAYQAITDAKLAAAKRAVDERQNR